MSDQNVSLRIDAKPLSGLDKPFKDMAAGASLANDAVKKLNAEAAKSGGAGAGFSGGFGFGAGAAKIGGFAGGLEGVNRASKDLGSVLSAATGEVDIMRLRQGTLGDSAFRLARGFATFADRIGVDINGWGELFRNAAKASKSLAILEQDRSKMEFAAAHAPGRASLGVEDLGAQLGFGAEFRRQNPLQLGKSDRQGLGLAFRMQETGEERFVLEQQAARVRSRRDAGAANLSDLAAPLQGAEKLLELGTKLESLRKNDYEKKRPETQRAASEWEGYSTSLGGAKLGTNESFKYGTAAALQSRRDQVLTAMGPMLESQQQLVQLEQRQLDTIRQQGRERVMQLSQQKNAYDEEIKQLNQLVDTEKKRLGGFAADFGSLSPGEQRKSRELAEKIASGQELSRGELEFARGKSFFGESVQRQAEAMGGRAGFGDVQRLLGLDRGLQQAEAATKTAVEARVEIENKITAEIKVNEQSMAEQLTQRLLPELTKLSAMLEQQAKLKLDGFWETLRMQRLATLNE